MVCARLAHKNAGKYNLFIDLRGWIKGATRPVHVESAQYGQYRTFNIGPDLAYMTLLRNSVLFLLLCYFFP